MNEELLESIEFELAMEPVPKGRPRFNRSGHAYTDHKTRKFENEFIHKAFPFRPKTPLEGAVRLEVVFRLTPPKRCPRKYPSCSLI